MRGRPAVRDGDDSGGQRLLLGMETASGAAAVHRAGGSG
jgi:hypothetical protein